VQLESQALALLLGGTEGCSPELPVSQQFRHIPDGADHTVTFRGGEGAEADLDGNLLPVGAKTEQLQPDTHGPGARIIAIAGPMGRMRGAETVRDERLDVETPQLIHLVAE
jgi:hypothetical protein